MRNGDNYNISTTSTIVIKNTFEKAFLEIPLTQQILHCNNYELTPLFKKWLPYHQPILEAGSGSGRWVAWFLNQGWQSLGLDWSETLCEIARSQIPGGDFRVGDMSDMPFKNGEFGSIVALGSIEHHPDGPDRILSEFYRVLKKDGLAIITVPYNGSIRRFLNPTRIKLSMYLRQNQLIRQLFNKKKIIGKNLSEAREGVVKKWSPVFIHSDQGWNFFEYRFTKVQMRDFMKRNKFEILEEFVEFWDEGILHNFGSIAGKYDFQNARVVFSPLGKLLKNVLPVDYIGHMVCYVVRKI